MIAEVTQSNIVTLELKVWHVYMPPEAWHVYMPPEAWHVYMPPEAWHVYMPPEVPSYPGLIPSCPGSNTLVPKI